MWQCTAPCTSSATDQVVWQRAVRRGLDLARVLAQLRRDEGQVEGAVHRRLVGGRGRPTVTAQPVGLERDPGGETATVEGRPMRVGSSGMNPRRRERVGCHGTDVNRKTVRKAQDGIGRASLQHGHHGRMLCGDLGRRLGLGRRDHDVEPVHGLDPAPQRPRQLAPQHQRAVAQEGKEPLALCRGLG